MQKWEYTWVYVTREKGALVFVANGQRLQTQTYSAALNALGKDGWELVTVIPPPIVFPIGRQAFRSFV